MSDNNKAAMDAQFEEVKKERAKFAAMVSFEAKDAYLGDYADFLIRSGKTHTDELGAVYFHTRAKELSFETPADFLNNRPRYEYLMQLSRAHWGAAVTQMQFDIEKVRNHA